MHPSEHCHYTEDPQEYYADDKNLILMFTLMTSQPVPMADTEIKIEHVRDEMDIKGELDYNVIRELTPATIASTAVGKANIFDTKPDKSSDHWRKLDPVEWDTDDVLHWIVNVSAEANFSYEDVNAKNFSLDGRALVKLSRDEFLERDSRFGGILYDYLYGLTIMVEKNLHELKPVASESKPRSPIHDTLDCSDPYSFQLRAPRPAQSSRDSESEPEVPFPPKKIKRPPGRPPGAKAKAKIDKKTGRLWEFIRNLLHNPQFCPSVICWENHDEGVFRFVKSEKVAKIWGDRKNNQKMNYEKLSRAMRYYYKSQVFQPVLGRKLVYKFGPNAKEWRSANPNFRQSGDDSGPSKPAVL